MPTPLHQWVLNWNAILNQFPRENTIVRFTDAIFVGAVPPDFQERHDNDNADTQRTPG